MKKYVEICVMLFKTENYYLKIQIKHLLISLDFVQYMSHLGWVSLMDVNLLRQKRVSWKIIPRKNFN